MTILVAEMDVRGPVRFVTSGRHLYCGGPEWQLMLCDTEDDRGCDVEYGPGILDVFLTGSAVTACWIPHPLYQKEGVFPSGITIGLAFLTWIKEKTGLNPIHFRISEGGTS
jgi:hypothetical protein